MTHTSFLIEALNDLIQINKDRITGYAEAAQKMDNVDVTLKETCLVIVDEAKKNINELVAQLNKIASEQPSVTKNTGKVFQLWKDVSEADAQIDASPTFASCVVSEDAVQQVYEETLLTYAFMPAELRAVITRQKKNIGQAKKIIMNYLQSNNRAVA